MFHMEHLKTVDRRADGQLMDKRELIKLDYEMTHSSPEELAETHGVSVYEVKNIIENTPDIMVVEDDPDEDSLTTLKKQVSAFGTINQAGISRRYTSIQSSILDKLELLVDEIEDPHDLKVLNEVLLSHRPTLMEGGKDAGKNGGQGAFTIRILGMDGDGGITNAVEISSSAGMANGLGELTRGVPCGTP